MSNRGRDRRRCLSQVLVVLLVTGTFFAGRASAQAVCGNAICESADGENCTSCPGDCLCPVGQLCNDGLCVLATTTTEATSTTRPPFGLCGDPTGDGNVTASDALATLRAATGLDACPLCRCDVDVSASITATDALAVLRSAVGETIELNCIAC